MSAPSTKILHNQSPLIKAVDTDLVPSQTYSMMSANNYSVSIQFLVTLGAFTSIRVKLTDIHFQDGPRRPCFLRVLSRNAINECPIERNGWYSIDGPFEISQSEIITFACISTWGPQIAGLQEAKIEAIEFTHRIDYQRQDLNMTSATESSALLALRSVDPVGITVRINDTFIKFIRNDSVFAWKTFLESNTFKELTIAGSIIPSTTLETGQPYFTYAIISNSVWGPSHLLTFSQAKNLARHVISLMKDLIDQENGGYCLIDAHPGNFSQTGAGTFSLVDFGSISDFEPNIANGGLENFTRMILAPLAICASELVSTFGEAFQVFSTTGIEIDGQVIHCEESLQMIIDSFKIPVSRCRSVPEFIELFVRLNQWIDSLTRPTNADFLSGYQLDKFRINEISQSMQWLVDPNQNVSSFSDRDRSVIELLSAMNYDSLIDLGCNTGKFSIYAALLGYQVSAIDSNEQVVDALFEFAKSEGMPISAYQGSVFNKDYLQACGADVVLALALTHHLILGNYSPAVQPPNSMDSVCALIASLAKKAALIEFMPIGMGSAVNDFLPLPNPLPNWYTVNNFELTLSKFFSTITKVKYDGEVNPTRVLFVCEK